MAKKIFDTVNQDYQTVDNQTGLRGDGNIAFPGNIQNIDVTSKPLGRYGIGDTKYDKDINLTELVYGGPNYVEATRAYNQKAGDEFLGWLNQTITGEIIGGSIEALGYLLDVDSYKQITTDTEDDFGNLISEFGKSMKTWAQEKTPIYTNPNDSSFNPGKSEWWFKNGVSVASTLSMMIPAAGAVKGLELLAKGLKVGKLLNKLGETSKVLSTVAKFAGGEAGQATLRGVNQAVLSRHMENMMEASQTYESLYNKYLPTMTEEEARKAASEGASQVYDRNWVMLVQDIPQYLLMNKIFLGKSIEDGAKVAEAMGKGVGGAAATLGKKIAPYIQDSIGEGFEEMYQYIVQQEAEYMMDKRHDMAVESTFGERLDDYLKDGEMWTSFTMGMLGSGVQQSVGPVINKAINKIKDPNFKSTEQRKMDDIAGWNATFRHANDVYKEFAEMGHEDAFESARDILIANIAEKSASLGNFHNAVEFFEQLAKGDPETLANYGLTKEDVELVTKDSERSLADLNRYSEIYDSVEKRFKKGIIKKAEQIAPVARLEFEREKLIEGRDKTNAKLDEALDGIKDFEKLSMNTQDNILISRKLKSNQKLLDLQNKFLEKSKNKRDQANIKSKIAKVEKVIEDLKNDLTENVEARTNEDAKQDKGININEKYYDDVDSLLGNLMVKEQRIKEVDDRIKQYEKSSSNLSSEEEQADYNDRQDSTNKDDKTNLPKENDLVSYTDLTTGEVKGAIVRGINPEDELVAEIEFLDQEGNPTGEKINVPISSINLEVDLESLDGDNVEPENFISDDRLQSIKDRVPKNYTILPYSMGSPRSKNFKVFDPELSAFISDPNNTLYGAKAVFEIDVNRMLQDKSLDEKVIKKIRSGRKLTAREVESILKGDTGDFSHFLSNVPIKIQLISKGANRASDLYLYKGKNAEENSFRYKILLQLLQGKEVWSEGVMKANSGNVNSGHEDILISDLGIDINTAELGVVVNELTGGIQKERNGSEHPIGTGNVGNTFLFTDLIPNKKDHAFPVKLNVQKLSKEHAEILYDAFVLAYSRGSQGLNTMFPETDGRVQGDITVGDVLNYLVNWGEAKTSFDKKGRLVPLGEHLKSKQLFYKKSTLYYGTNSIILHKATAEQKAHFIEWAMNNKNYKVSLDTSKTELNKVDNRKFKIGSIETDGKTRYATTLMKHGMVKTDVRKVKNEKGEEVDSIFKDPLLLVSNQDKDLKTSTKLRFTKPISKQKVEPVKAETKKEEPVREDATPTPKEERQVKRVELGDNVLKTSDQIKSLPAGTDLYYEVTEYDDEDNATKRKVIVGTIVLRNGKKVFLNKSKNDVLNSIHQMPSTSDKVSKGLINLFDGVGDMNTLRADVEQVAKPVSKEETKSKEEPTDDIGFGDFEAKPARLRKEVPKDYVEQDYEKEVKKWLRSRLGKDTSDLVKLSNKILEIAESGATAWGVYSHNAIELYKRAEEGTIYHEGWHRVSYAYFSDKERKMVYDKARIKYSMMDATDTQIEERLAEEFRDYVLTNEKADSILAFVKLKGSEEKAAIAIFEQLGGSKSLNAIRSEIDRAKEVKESKKRGLMQIISDIYEFIRSVFVGESRLKTYEIDKIFASINRGKYKYAKIRKENVDNLKGYSAPRLNIKLGELNEVNTSDQVRSIVRGLTAMLINSNNIQDLNDLKANDIKFRPLIDQLKGAVENFKKQGTEKFNDLSKLYGEVVSDLEKPGSIYRELLTDYLTVLNIRKNSDEADLMEDNADEVQDTGVERHNKASYEINGKNNVLTSVKFLIATLPESAERDAFTHMFPYADFSYTWNSLLRDLSSESTIEEMIDTLNSFKDNYVYSQLAKKLEDVDKPGNQILRSQFETAIRQHRHSFLNVTMKNITKSMEVSKADLNSAVRLQRNLWGQSFYLSKYVNKPENEKASLNVEEFDKLVDQYKIISRKAKTELGKGDINEERRKDYIRNVVTLLNEIGIGINEDTINYYLHDKADMNQALVDLIQNDISLLFGFNRNRMMKPDEKSGTPLNDPYGGQFATMVKLSKMHVEAHPDLIDESVLGPKNNLYYVYSLNSLVTDIVRDLKKDDKYLTNLSDKEYSKHSIIINQLLGDEKAKEGVNLYTFSGLFAPGKEGNDYMEMSPVDDYITKLLLSSKDYILFPTMADKKTYYLLDGIKMPTVRIGIDNTQREYHKIFTLNKEAEDVLFGYYQDELDRVKRAMDTREKYLDLVDKYEKATDSKVRNNIKSNIMAIHNKMVEHYNFKKISNKKGENIYKDKNGFFTQKALDSGNALFFSNFSSLNTRTTKDGLVDLSWHTDEAIRDHINFATSKQISIELEYAIEQGIIERDPNDGKLSFPHMFDKPTIDKYGENYGSFNDGAKGLIGEYLVKSIISNIELEKIMSGDPAFFKSGKYNESFNDKVKRLSGLTSTGNKIRESIPGLGKDLETRTYTTAVMNTQKFKSFSYNKMVDNYKRILIERYKELYPDKSESDIIGMAGKDATSMLKAYTEVDPTDAQVYITPALYRSINNRLGEWSDLKQEAYDLLISDRDLTVEEERKALNVVMSPLKLTHYGFVNNNNLSVPVYDKMSLAPIFRRVAKGSQIEVLLDRMEAVGKYEGLDKIEMIKADTAVKSGATDGFDFYTNPERTEIKEDLSDLNYITQEFKYLRRQLVTEPHDSETATIGTQFLKIAMSNIFKDRKIYNIDGVGKVTGNELVSIINSSLSHLSTIGQKRLTNKLGFDVESGIIRDKGKFLEFLKKEAKQADLEDNLTLALREDENGDFYMNLDSLPNRKWIESRIISLVNKHVVNRAMPGKQLIQMSNFGIRDIKEDNSLKFIDLDIDGNKVEAMEGKVSINVFKDLIPDYENKTFEEKVKYLLDNKLDVIVGYRIPTQGLSSIVAIKAVQFLPEAYGDTISLPEEFTALTGSDFDIDKLFVIRHNYRVNSKGELTKTKFLQGTSEKEYQERYNLKAWEEYKLNKYIFEDELIDEIKEINERLHANKYANEKEWTADLTRKNEILGEVIKTLQDEGILPSIKKFKTLDIVEQNTEAAIQNRLLSSYISILTNANHYIEATSPLGFLGDELKKIHAFVTKNEGSSGRVTSFGALTPKYNHSVKFNNSGGKTGVGPFALSKAHHVLAQIVGLKHKSGDDLGRMYGDDKILISEWLSILIDKHVDIAKDPMIMGLNVNSQTYDVVNYMIRAGYGGEKTFMFSSQPILKEYANKLINAKSYSFPKDPMDVKEEITSALYDKVKELSDMTKDSEIQKKINSLLADTMDIKKLTNRIEKTGDLTLDDYLFDLAILQRFESINDKGQDLFSLVMASRVDTRKWGKNLVDVKAFINSAQDVLSKRRFNDEALQKLIPPFNVPGGTKVDYDNTFVANYFINAVLYTRRLLSPLTIYATTGFDYMISDILRGSGNENTIDSRLINKASDELFASIISRFFSEDKQFKSSQIKNLLVNKDNIMAKVAHIKNHPEQYPDLKDNKLLNYIIPVFKDNDILPNFFRISSVRLEGKWEKDDIVRAWKDLLTHPDKEVQSIGRNLLSYAFYTTGFRNRLNGFSNLIPVELLKEIGFDDFIKKTLDEYKDMDSADLLLKFEEIKNDVFENNSQLNSLVPMLKSDKVHALKIDNDNDNTTFALIVGDDQKAIIGKQKDNGEPIYLKYVKYSIGEGRDNYRLFKYVGNVGSTSNGAYVAVDKKGYESKGIILKEYGLKETILDGNKNNLNIEESRMMDMIEAYAKDKIRKPSTEWTSNENLEEEDKGFTDYEEVEQKELPANTEEVDPTKDTVMTIETIEAPEGFAEITDEVMKSINDKFGDTYTKEQLEGMSEKERINILKCL